VVSIAEEPTGQPHELPGVPEIGSTMLEKYRIERVVGRGGMGVVMEAWHLQLDERVAIKFLLPELGANEEAIARFEREARALFKIKSEHVCRVLDVGKLDGVGGGPGIPYMVMEYLEGQDLAAVLSSRRGLPIDVSVSWALQTCQALAEAHSRGIVHRDLKPENLFLSERRDGTGCIKLLDFGLSKVAEEQGERAPRKRKLTSHQRVMGTPNYMSPEQWQSARDVGPAADQWAVGIILYELVAGVPPFDAEQMAQICSKVLHEPTPSLSDMRSDVPAGLDLGVRKSLEKRPDQRYSNIGTFAVALARFGGRGAVAEAERSLSMLKKAPDRSSQLPIVVVPSSSDSGAESDMLATVPVPPSFDPEAAIAAAKAKPKRAVTAQSWQQVLMADTPHQRSRKALIVAMSAVALVMLLFGVFALSGSNASESAAAASPAADGQSTTATASEAVAKPATSPSIDAKAEDTSAEDAQASASASATASAAAKPARVTKPRRASRARKSPPKRPPTSTPPPAKDKKRSIFDERW
jgi:serine/threonine-protein kinase